MPTSHPIQASHASPSGTATRTPDWGPVVQASALLGQRHVLGPATLQRQAQDAAQALIELQHVERILGGGEGFEHARRLRQQQALAAAIQRHPHQLAVERLAVAQCDQRIGRGGVSLCRTQRAPTRPARQARPNRTGRALPEPTPPDLAGLGLL